MLHFWEVEEGAKTGTMSGPESCMVMVEVETKVNEAASCWLTVNENVGLWQVPPSSSNKELGYLVIKLVGPSPGLVMVSYGPINCILQIHLATH